MAMPSPVRAKDDAPSGYPSLAKATILIIRHAEKPDQGDGLSPAGTARANAYVNYFEHYQVNGTAPIKLTALFAAADSDASHRPSLTLEPLSQATDLPIDSQYKDHDYAKLVDALQSADHGKHLLICWHQGKIPDLVRALGADPDDVLAGRQLAGQPVRLGHPVALRQTGATQIGGAYRRGFLTSSAAQTDPR